jgi:hypothetical protein
LFWQALGMYCINMMTSKFFSSKYCNLDALFPKLFFEPIVLDFILLPWQKILPQGKTVTRP